MTRRIVMIALALAAGIFADTVRAATQVVNDFGAAGWKSWDTRDSSNNRLFGSTNTHVEWTTYWGETATGAADTQIESQIKFLGEGQTANTVAGGTPALSPTGALNGLGYVRLDGTGTNSGKSDISYVNSVTGIASTSALLDDSFGAQYRFYPDSTFSSRTPGLNIEFINTTSNVVHTLVFVQTPYTADAWNTATVNNNTSLFSVYGPGAPGGAVTKSLSDWSNDSTWGPVIFDNDATIFRVGFNIGSSQSNGLVYIDWLQTSLLNGGDVIDYQAVPEPASIALAGMALVGAAGYAIRRKRRSAVNAA